MWQHGALPLNGTIVVVVVPATGCSEQPVYDVRHGDASVGIDVLLQIEKVITNLC